MMECEVRRAGIWDAEALSDVAATTFPLACPPDLAPDDVAVFIDEVLSVECFGEYLADPQYTVLQATSRDAIVGYAMLIDRAPSESSVAEAVNGRPVLEISKMYVLPGHHGAGVSTALMTTSLDYATNGQFAGTWLAVNQDNARAQRFYRKHGFDTVGTRTFTVGAHLCHDFVMYNPLS